MVFFFFFFQAEDGIRDLVRSRGLGDVYKRQYETSALVKTQLTAAGIAFQENIAQTGVVGFVEGLSLIHI